MSGKEPEPTSFWTTAPGILTAIAAVVTAVGGLITALALTGVFGPGAGGVGTTGVVETAPTGSPTAPSPSPDQAVPEILLASFEQDTEGWGPKPDTEARGTTTRVSDYHTDGEYGLAVDPTKEGWFGTVFDVSQNISGSTSVSADVETVRGDPKTNLAILLKGYVWCEAVPKFLKPTGTVTLDLGTMTCRVDDKPVRRPSNLSELTEVWLYLHPGSFRVDNVRAE